MGSEHEEREVVVWAKWVVVGVIVAELAIRSGVVDWRVVGTLGVLAVGAGTAGYLREREDEIWDRLLEPRRRRTDRGGSSLGASLSDLSPPTRLGVGPLAARVVESPHVARVADSAGSMRLPAPEALAGLVERDRSQSRLLRYRCLSCEAPFTSATEDMSKVACPECDARRVMTVGAERSAPGERSR